MKNPSNLITLQEYADMIGKEQSSVRKKCLRGNVPGAVKIGRDWLIPADAPYPDARVTSGKYRDWRKKYPDRNKDAPSDSQDSPG